MALPIPRPAACHTSGVSSGPTAVSLLRFHNMFKIINNMFKVQAAAVFWPKGWFLTFRPFAQVSETMSEFVMIANGWTAKSLTFRWPREGFPLYTSLPRQAMAQRFGSVSK